MATVIHRTLRGIVRSDKMSKTVVVQVDRVTTHPKYGKQYVVSKRYKAHDEQNRYHPGDTVEIVATHPMSKGKRWKVVRKI